MAACAAARVPLLLGTSGLPRELDAPLAAAAEVIPLLVAPNTSLGVNVLLELVRQAAAGAAARATTSRSSNRTIARKRDAPSGTALALGEAAARGRGLAFDEQAVYARHGHTGPRGSRADRLCAWCAAAMWSASMRCWLLGDGERLLLKHSATDRAVFARGALLAGQWLARQSAWALCYA